MFVLQNAYREKLEQFPKIAPRDSAGLRRYADLLRQCLSASRVIPSMSALNDIRENKRMQGKLPEWLVRRWARIIATYKSRSEFPSFEVFADFLAAEAEIACDPCALTSSEKTNKDSKTAQQKRQSFATTGSQKHTKTDKSGEQPKINTTKSTSEAKRPKKRWPCVLCNGEHRLDNCEDFKNKSLSEKREVVERKGLCFNCLVPKHMTKECRNEARCTVCKRKHSTLLYSDSGDDSGQITQPVDVKTTEGTTAPKVVSNRAHVHLAVEGGSKTSMILPVYISHPHNPDNEELIYAMLDQQSEITFLLDSVYERLGLTGSETELSLSTMSAINQKILTTKVMNPWLYQ